MGQNSKIHCDKTQKLKLWQNSKNQCDKNQNLKLWQNSKTQFVTKFKLKLWPLQNWYCDKSKTEIVNKLKNSNFDQNQDCDKTQLKLWQNLNVLIVTNLSKNNFNTFTTDKMFKGQRFAILAMFETWSRDHFSLTKYVNNH